MFIRPLFIRGPRHRLPAAGAVAVIALALAAAVPAAQAASSGSANSVTLPPPGYQTAAAAPTLAERCKIYENHFDQAVATRAEAPRIDEARVLRIEGGKLCGAGAYQRGSQKLREALDRIDLTVPF